MEINRAKLFSWEIYNTPISDYAFSDDDFDMGCQAGQSIAVDKLYESVVPRQGDTLDRIAAWYKWVNNKCNSWYFDKFDTVNRHEPYYYGASDSESGAKLVLNSFYAVVANGATLEDLDKEWEDIIKDFDEIKKKEDEEEENLDEALEDVIKDFDGIKKKEEEEEDED